MGSVIGVSQTKAAIPRILTRFQDDLNSCQGLENKIALPNHCLADQEKRNFHGGIYSWQPSSYRNQIISSLRNQSQYADQIELNRLNQPAAVETLMRNQLTLQFSVTSRTRSNMHDMIIAHLIVVAGALAGFIISSLVPPEGWNCRHYGEFSILFVWILSAYIDIQLNKVFSLNGKPRKFLKWRIQSSTALFWVTFFKDIVFTAATMFSIVIIQCGILNRCKCYSNWGRKGLQLPEMPDVDNVLRNRINGLYPAIVGLGLGFQLILVSLYFHWQYGSALQVYVQRDDGKSNTPSWVKRVTSWGRRVVPKRAQFRR